MPAEWVRSQQDCFSSEYPRQIKMVSLSMNKSEMLDVLFRLVFSPQTFCWGYQGVISGMADVKDLKVTHPQTVSFSPSLSKWIVFSTSTTVTLRKSDDLSCIQLCSQTEASVANMSLLSLAYIFLNDLSHTHTQRQRGSTKAFRRLNHIYKTWSLLVSESVIYWCCVFRIRI